jgi:hypothetical protein
MKVATLERIRREKNRDARRFRSAFFARGNQPYVVCETSQLELSLFICF